ncbi:transposase [Fictibacillus sp. Mic-4]|uniref:zinc ribbon domain-containing protein n=1 Tax=Fictibacillus sp. Mic-4 TaxID=3132826 RepID=UPI003CF791B9
MGRVSGIEKNTKKDKKKKSKTTKVRRQQLSLWNQGKIKQKLTYKAELKGIKVEETEESYTSQTCPFCHGRHKTNGRQFKCSVRQTEIHRDVNGAQNIVRKKYPMEVNSQLEVVFKQPVWYKRYVNGNHYFLTGQDRHQSSHKSIARRMA